MKKLILNCLMFLVLSSGTAFASERMIATDTISGENETITYTLTDNANSIQLNLKTADTKTIMTMLHRGVTVFFDLKGKEKEDVAITYPINANKMPQERPTEPRSTEFQSEADVAKQREAIYNMFTIDFPEEAQFKKDDNTQNFNVLLNGLDIQINYNYNKATGILNYDIRVPKSRLKDKSKDDFSKLKIGVKTGGAKDEMAERPETMQQGGRGQGGRGGGGRGSGGGRGGRGGGRSQGAQQSQGERTKGPVGIDFWFEAHM